MNQHLLASSKSLLNKGINLTAYSKLFTPSFAILGREKLAVICRLSQR